MQLTQRNMSIKTAWQYVNEEHALLRKRYNLAEKQLQELFQIMAEDTISKPAHIRQLAQELSKYHQAPEMLECRNMGEILQENIRSRLKLA